MAIYSIDKTVLHVTTDTKKSKGGDPLDKIFISWFNRR